MQVSELKVGQKALIVGFSDEWTGLKLMHMGLCPGEVLTVFLRAPSGDRFVIESSGIKLALRKNEAQSIELSAIKE